MQVYYSNLLQNNINKSRLQVLNQSGSLSSWRLVLSEYIDNIILYVISVITLYLLGVITTV